MKNEYAESTLDLNLLAVLVALDEQRSVSRAADMLVRSQPAVSAALARLRAYFNDPLFLRVRNSMEPTPRAAAVVKAARAVLKRINAEIIAQPAFDPAASDKVIRLALSDVGEIVFLPTILTALRRLMPRATFCSMSLPAAALPAQLESGGVDLAIGYFPDLRRGGFFQQTLFKDSFVCLLRADHPLVARKLTIRQFLQLEHAVVRVESRTEEVIERYLVQNKLRRRVVLTSPHFASTPLIVAQSDLVVTVPAPLARYFAGASANLRVAALPFEAPRIELRQFWHRRFQNDARNRWLRGIIYGLFESRRKQGETAP